MGFRDELLAQAEGYAAENGLKLGKELGFGVHGIVFVTELTSPKARSAKNAALKVYQREVDFFRERDVYLRLQQKKLSQIRGHQVPQLLGYDENWLVLEMTLVTRPFVLDFAGAYLDRMPDFSEEVMADWRADKQEQFGKRWPEVQAILAVLETHGVYMEDVHPGNIAFADSLARGSS